MLQICVVGCLQTLFFNVADVAFRCCRHVVLGVVLRRRVSVRKVVSTLTSY
jgi:hypothetical protein